MFPHNESDRISLSTITGRDNSHFEDISKGRHFFGWDRDPAIGNQTHQEQRKLGRIDFLEL